MRSLKESVNEKIKSDMIAEEKRIDENFGVILENETKGEFVNGSEIDNILDEWK